VGTEHYAAVADMLQNASNAETLSKVIRARSRVTTLQRDASDAPELLRGIQGRIAALTESRTRLEQLIGELGTRIENLPVAEIAEREAARSKLEKAVARLIEEIGAIKQKAKVSEDELATLKKQSERLMRHNRRAQRLLNRRNLADESRKLLEEALGKYETTARIAIKDKVDAILSDVAHRDYACDLGDDFSLRLQMRSGHGIPKSGGENQLLSLVFIGALVQYAASRLNDNTVVLRPGTVAPLVLDAPLGQLDVDYQEAVAKYLPTLADQVVLLLSSSQCGPRVLDALEPRIGAEYVLISENTEPRGERRDSRLMIGAKEFVCSEFNRPRQMTRIERIR
jgi:DNA sulfur modification protein DndD